MPQTQAPGDLGVIWVSTSTVINIGLLKLPLDSVPKLTVGQWIPWWSGFPRESSSRGKLCMLSYHSGHIYRTWKNRWIGGGRFWSYHMWTELQRDGTIFMGEVDPSRYHVKVLIWQLGLKTAAGKSIFHAIISALYPLWWKFYWLSESTFIFSMLESQSWKSKILTKMWRLKRW